MIDEKNIDGSDFAPPDPPGEDVGGIQIQVFSEDEIQTYQKEKEREERFAKPPEERYAWKRDRGEENLAELRKILSDAVSVLASIDNPGLEQNDILEASTRLKTIFRSALDYYFLLEMPYHDLIKAICQTHSLSLPCDRTSYFGEEQKLRRGIVIDQTGDRKVYDTVLIYSIYFEKATVETIELTIPMVWDGTPNLRAGFIGEVYRANAWYARPVKEQDRIRLEYSVSSFKWENFGGIPVFATAPSGIEVNLRDRFENRRKLAIRGIFQFFNKLDSSGRPDPKGFRNTERIKSELYAFCLGAVLTEFIVKYPDQSGRFVFQSDNNYLIRGLKRAEEIKSRR